MKYKKYIIIVLFVLIVLTSCSKATVDDYFSRWALDGNVEDSHDVRIGTNFGVTWNITSCKEGTGCGYFDGTTYISFADIVLDNISYSMWFKQEGGPNISSLFANMYSTIRVTPTSITYWPNRLVTGFIYTWIPDGDWHHLTVTQDNTTLICNMYLDAKLVKTGSCLPIDPTVATGYIGKLWEDRFEGFIDDVRVYDHILNLEDVKLISGLNQSSYIPSTPIYNSITNYTNNITVTWDAGSGNVTNAYNISWTNSSHSGWENLTSSTTFIVSTRSHQWGNVSIYAINTSGNDTISTLSLNVNGIYSVTPPTTPAISFPVNNSRQWNNTINFTWNLSTNDYGDTILYNYSTSTNSGFTENVNSSNTSNLFSGIMTTETDGITYYLRVRSYDGTLYSPWSQHILFVENTKPTFDNITMEPVDASSTQNLTAKIYNINDAEGDTISKYYFWYINGSLNNSFNNSPYLNYTGRNFSTGDNIYAKVILRDGYENTSEQNSNIVIIGSDNTAPYIDNITLSPSVRKYNKTIWVNSSTITDTESVSVQLQVYWYNNSVKTFLENSSWFSVPSLINVSITIPWIDGLNHTIYAIAKDSGSGPTQSDNITSGEVNAEFESDIEPPTYINSSLEPSTISVGNEISITLNTQCTQSPGFDDCSITNVTYKVLDPSSSYGTGDDGKGNYTMTHISGTLWADTFNTTNAAGIYKLDTFFVTDNSTITGKTEVSLTFTATTPSTSTSTTIISGGGGALNPPDVLINATFDTGSLLKLKNLTNTLPSSIVQKIQECYTTDLLLKPECAESIIFTEPINWMSAILGSLLGAFITMFYVRVISRDRRSIIPDVILYGTISFIIVQLLVVVGLNVYFLNFLLQSNLPGYLFMSFVVWGLIFSYVIYHIIRPK